MRSLKPFVIFGSLVIELLALNRWLSCWHFKDIFYYTPTLLIARVINGINDDYGLPSIVTHTMHNKITYFFWGFIQAILQYWDIRFLKEFIGIIGAIGIYLAIWYLITKHRRNKYIWSLFIFSIVLGCIEIFFSFDLKFAWKLLILGVPYMLFSLFGIWQFLNERKRSHYLFIILIMILSAITILLFPLGHYKFCLKM